MAFVAAPILLLLVVLRHELRWISWATLSGLCLVALVYTTPWDNLLILNGVWTYPPARVLNITFGVVPIEEYSFFVLQTLLVGLFTLALLRRERA